MCVSSGGWIKMEPVLEHIRKRDGKKWIRQEKLFFQSEELGIKSSFGKCSFSKR